MASDENGSAAASTDDAVLEDLEAAVLRQSLHREILYKTLGYCQEGRTLAEIEEEIASYPEFETALQSQFFMVQVLVRHGGLECVGDGQTINAENLANLDDDEFESLAAEATFTTTETGMSYYNAHRPEDRLSQLFEDEAERADTYREIMEYCATQTHPYTDIAELLDGREIMTVWEDDGRYLNLQASVFLDKLERAGGMYWTRADGWATSEDGLSFIGSSS